MKVPVLFSKFNTCTVHFGLGHSKVQRKSDLLKVPPCKLHGESDYGMNNTLLHQDVDDAGPLCQLDKQPYQMPHVRLASPHFVAREYIFSKGEMISRTCGQ